MLVPGGRPRFPAPHPRLPGAASAVYVFLKRPEGLVFTRTCEQYLLARPFRDECVSRAFASAAEGAAYSIGGGELGLPVEFRLHSME